MRINNTVVINENRRYFDIESGEIVTELELYNEYLQTEQLYSFWGYLRNCTDKNGTLEQIN